MSVCAVRVPQTALMLPARTKTFQRHRVALSTQADEPLAPQFDPSAPPPHRRRQRRQIQTAAPLQRRPLPCTARCRCAVSGGGRCAARGTSDRRWRLRACGGSGGGGGAAAAQVATTAAAVATAAAAVATAVTEAVGQYNGSGMWQWAVNGAF